MNSSSRSPAVPFIRKACGLDLREFQTDYLTELFQEDDEGRRVYTLALWGMPRGNGKTELAAAVAIHQLIGDGRLGAVVVIAAGSREQAAIAFASAKRMIANSSVLSRHLRVLPGRKIINHDASDSQLFIVSRESKLAHGLRPSAVIFDELWNQPDRDLWDALVGGTIKVSEPLQLCITTAGYDSGSLLADLVERGESGEDPRFLYRWHGLPKDSDLDYRDPETWKVANPAMVCERPFLAEAGVRDSLARMHEAEFRRWHLNQWTRVESQWLPPGVWAGLGQKQPVTGRVILGFAGTYSGDSAALVGCTDKGYVFVIDSWESDEEIGVSRAKVKAAVAKAMTDYRPKRMVCNEIGWKSEIEEWQEHYGANTVPALDWTHHAKRKADACTRFYSAVLGGDITHDGDRRLADSLASAVVKETPEGAYISKGGRESLRKVELAVAAVMAFDMAAEPMKRNPYEEHGLRVI